MAKVEFNEDLSRRFNPGTLVKVRGREWVLEACDIEGCVKLRPLGGTDGDVQILMPSIEDTELESATFPLPDSLKPGSYSSAFLLRNALRLKLTNAAGPFRSLGHVAVEPRSYQLVPLLMALKQNPVRLLIADDVGIGKTIEAGLIVKQLPVLPPSAYHEAALSFIVPRVMALTYTANDMTEWAKALWNDSTPAMRQKMLELNGKSREFSQENSGSTLACDPYIYDDAKRAVLRAELDAYFARLYGLTHTELQYILDPRSVMGEDYPSETFRVLKDNEIAKYGEYRTQRLVLEAWDRME